MNKEKTPEDKLREAAEAHTGYMFAGRLSPITPDSFKKAIEYFAKSKAAAEYHQSLQPKVDLDELEKQILANFPYRKVSNDGVSEILDFLKPYLQTPAPESDAVDFYKWVRENGFVQVIDGSFVEYKGARHFSDLIELYAEYKQSKTK